jgi:demethylmenaquinone methyltransferase/2-methoxy-6-polyprenyl-1,4-benzoquinol methylase
VTDEQTREYYRYRAPEYEQIYYRDIPERRREIDEEVAFVRDLGAGRDVLDLACGTGYWTQVLAETAHSVVATDYWPEMLEQARRKQYRNPPVFMQADIARPPFGNNTFDLIMLGFWLSHQPKQTLHGFLELICRPLRPGGQVWMIDNNPPAEGAEMHTVNTDENGNHFKRRWLDDGREFVILKNYFSEEELQALVTPHFGIDRLIYGKYYWSLLVHPRSSTDR